MRQGRPLRFLALVLGGWVTARTVVLWPTGETSRGSTERARHGAVARAGSPWQVKSTEAEPSAGLVSHPADGRRSWVATAPSTGRPLPRTLAQVGHDRFRDDANKAMAAAPAKDEAAVALASAPDPTTVADVPGAPSASGEPAVATASSRSAQSAARLHGDTYLVARPIGGDSLAFGQLGASQAGMRVTYALDDAHRLALSARVSTPLRGSGREAAFGVDLRPTRLPIHLLAEARLPLDGGPARPAAQLIGGFAHHLPLGSMAEAYAQGGGVYRRGGFADGAARLTRTLAATRLVSLDLGAGVWGAAQRGVTRLDVGPTLGLTLPARGGSVRLAIDYRRRAAGRARPGSGPAVSLGSSF